MKNISLAIWSVVFVIFAGSVNAQSTSTYDKCLAALAEGDLDQAKTLAAEIESKRNLTQENIIKGTRCLEETFGDIFWYDPDYNFWTKGDRAVNLKKMHEKQERKEMLKKKQAELQKKLKQQEAELQKKREPLEKKETCLISKKAAIDALKSSVFGKIIENNKQLINERTLSACVKINDADPIAAIMNPICREVFTQNLHPDLENQDLIAQYQELNSEDVVARFGLMETRLELEQLDNSTASANGDGKSIREQAFQTCE